MTALLNTKGSAVQMHHGANKPHTPGSRDRSSVRVPPWKYGRDHKDNVIFEEDEKHSLGCDDIWDQRGGLGQQRSLSQPMQQQMSIMDLPIEIRLLIFEHCAPIPSERTGANSMDTFRTLLQVSRTFQNEAYKACLPHIPLTLWTKKSIRSFRDFLGKHAEVRCLVRHLWIATGKYDDEELSWALDILKAAGQLRSLACGECFLAKAADANVLARTCQAITLMNLERGVVYQAQDVKRVRLCAGTYSTKEKFPNVTSLCFNARRRINGVKDERVREEYEMVDTWLGSLKSLVLVERDMKRASDRGLKVRPVIKRSGKPDMFSLVLPARWTEWDLWSADVVAAGIWGTCGIPEKYPSSSQPSARRTSIMDLPIKVRKLILEQCSPTPLEHVAANSMGTLRSLLRVSRSIRNESCKACLPHVPLALRTKQRVQSFRDFLYKHVGLRPFVRHLWIEAGKCDDDELLWCVEILKLAGELQSLACGEYFLSRAVHANVLARTCQTITLMNTERRSATYQAKDVKRLRLYTGVSMREKFPDITSVCLNAKGMVSVKDEGVKECEMMSKWSESLKSLVLMERDMARASDRGMKVKRIIRRAGKADVLIIVSPGRWTEWDIWSAEVGVAGIWDLCETAGE